MFQRACLQLLLGVLAGGLGLEVHGATIEVAEEKARRALPGLPSVHRTVRLKGVIEEGDAGKLRRLLADLTSAAGGQGDGAIVAELSGTDGDLLEGIKIGDLLREFHVSTVVRKGEVCLSACTVALIGGSVSGGGVGPPLPNRFIEIGGTVGMPNFYNPPPLRSRPSKYPVDKLLEYAARMGIEKGMRPRLMAESPEEMLYVTRVEAFLTIGVCPIGLGAPSTSLDAQAVNVCTRSVRTFDQSVALTSHPMTETEARLHLLKDVKTHIWWLGVVGDSKLLAPNVPKQESQLAERLKSDEFLKGEEAASRLYADLKAAGMPLPDLSGATFEVSGYNSANDKIVCIASLMPHDVEKYELVSIGPDGMKPPSRPAPRHCRGLYRYGDDDEINRRLP